MLARSLAVWIARREKFTVSFTSGCLYRLLPFASAEACGFHFPFRRSPGCVSPPAVTHRHILPALGPGCGPPGGSSGFDIQRRSLLSLAVLKTSGKRVGYRPKLRDDSGTVVSPFFFNPSFSGPHVVTTFRTGCVQQCQQSCQDPF